MVRRIAVAAALVVVAGCSLQDAFTGHENVVARAAGQELSVERVAAMIAPAKTVPLRREVIDRIAELWVDYQLLAQAVAAGDSLTDSATIAAASWPFIAQAVANRLHDTLVAGTAPTPAQVDSAYNGSDHRYIAHILVRVAADTTEAVKAAKRRVAEGYLVQVRGGADFKTLAGRVSEDPGSKPAGGVLGLVPRGVMIKAFEDAAFALQPGQVSNLVETAYGYHIIWRPELAQVRDSFTTDLADVFAQRFDSLYLDSLTNRTGIRVRGAAPAIVRAAARDLRAAKGRSRTLATYRNGRLIERDFARWLQAFPPQTRGMVQEAPDSTLIEFVKSIARNQMLLDAAAARGITLPAADWDSIRARYREQLAQMVRGMGIAAESLDADTTARALGRTAAAARAVDAYFEAISSRTGGRPYFEVPPFLADAIRSRREWRIMSAGVDRALERARVLRGPETPAITPPGVNQLTPAPIQPSPGGPPMRGN
jgi:hypothetical protein